MPSATTGAQSPPSSSSSTHPLAIIDTGASSLRITLQVNPTSSPHTHTCPNAIIRTRPPQRAVLIGSDIESQCTDFSCVTIRCPVERGFVTDWMAQKTIWDVELARALAALGYNGTGSLLAGWNVVITESCFNLPELETGLETLFLEEYGANAIWRCTPAQLASFAPMPGKKTAEPATSTPASQPPSTSTLAPPPTSRTSSRAKRNSSGSSSADDTIASSPKASTSSSSRTVSRRPEACVMIDLGHSYTHVVPLLHGQVVWSGVRRLDVGGKLMTNLLKEAISFTQWDVMEESWIISHLKERALFVAASEFDDDKSRPSGWDRHALARLRREAIQNKSRARTDPIEQEFVLPDYSDHRVARDPSKRYGRLRSGPGSDAPAPVTSTERDVEDAFIADPALVGSHMDVDVGPAHDPDSDSDSDAGEDYKESGSESETEAQPKIKPPRPRKTPTAPPNDEDEQAVRLSHERWQIPELLFHPQQLGLNALGLSELTHAAVNAATPDEAVRGLMYSNICLFGGLASLPGLRRRLENDLRALADEDFLVRVRTCAAPTMTAINGALHAPARVVQSHLMRKDEWSKGGTSLARQRFHSWGAPALS